jgi:hypothetical protein
MQDDNYKFPFFVVAFVALITVFFLSSTISNLNDDISIYKEALQECKDEPIVDKIIDKIRKEREK